MIKSRLENTNPKNEKAYSKKKLMTGCEYEFYLKLMDLEPKYKIIPQINLATVINKTSASHNYLDLFRNIDYGIFLLLLIELNDQTHSSTSRKSRDKKVKEICSKANIPLMTFYTSYSNNKDYVIKRIFDKIENKEHF